MCWPMNVSKMNHTMTSESMDHFEDWVIVIIGQIHR